MSEDLGNGGDGSRTPPFGDPKSPFNPEEWSASPNSTPPIGSHEEPCGKSICFPLLLKHWEDRLEAERTMKEHAFRFSPGPNFCSASQPTLFFELNSCKSSRTEKSSRVHPYSSPTRRQFSRYDFRPSTVSAFHPRSQPANSALKPAISPPKPVTSPPKPVTSPPKPAPFVPQPAISATPPSLSSQSDQKASTEPITQRRRNPVRKARSVPYDIRLAVGKDRSRKKAPKPVTPPPKSPEKPKNTKLAIPDILNQITIPEMFAKINIPKAPQLPNIPDIHIPEPPKIQLPELPKIPLPEMPKLHMPEIPKVSFHDFPQIFNSKPYARSAPAFATTMAVEKEETEPNPSLSPVTPVDSPRVESDEWKE